MRRIFVLAIVGTVLTVSLVPAASALPECGGNSAGWIVLGGYVERGETDTWPVHLDEGDALSWRFFPLSGWLDFRLRDCHGETIMEAWGRTAWTPSDPGTVIFEIFNDPFDPNSPPHGFYHLDAEVLLPG